MTSIYIFINELAAYTYFCVFQHIRRFLQKINRSSTVSDNSDEMSESRRYIFVRRSKINLNKNPFIFVPDLRWSRCGEKMQGDAGGDGANVTCPYSST